MEHDNRRKDRRKAVSLLVQLKTPDLGVFAEQFATNLSQGGMFLYSRQPQAVGTVVSFEVQIAGGVRAMRGVGEVRWVRHVAGRGGPPGMGLAFTQVDAPTRALIDHILAQEQQRAVAVRAKAEPAPAPTGTPPRPDDPLLGLIQAELGPGPLPDHLDVSLASLIASTPPPAPAGTDDGSTPDFELDISEEAPAPPPEQAAPRIERLDAPAPAVERPAPPALKTVFLAPPEPLTGGGPVIGIDLGTTNSCVAVLERGKPRVIRSREGYNTIPSVVSLTSQGRLLVGHRAKSQLLLNPTWTVYGAKRLVGRAYDSATVRQLRERFHYPVCADERRLAAVRLGTKVVTLEEIQGILLRECKELAEAELHEKVQRAVITVPAYYSEPQREAVRRAGALAGLEVARIVNEPTAAALTYGLNREYSKTVLVYDLGGGTFDATILRIEDNVFEVLATGGDTFLGGVDFDNLVVDYLLDQFRETTGAPFAGDRIAASRVADAAERAKIALSSQTSYEVNLPLITTDELGEPRDLRHTLTRAELERSCGGLVDRTLDVVQEVLSGAKLELKQLDDVLVVGGQSRMPLVREKLAARFGRPVQGNVHADEAVALGAALLAGSLDRLGSVVLIDVVPMTLGVGMPGGAYKRIIERNTSLPARRSFALATSKDDERQLELSLFQGEDEHVSGNEYLGTVRIDGLPRGPKGSVKVAVTVRLDSECVVHVEARELSTKKEVRVDFATRYSPQELQDRLALNAVAVKAAEARRFGQLLERAGRFWSQLRKPQGAG